MDCEALNLVQRINKVTYEHPEDQFSALFVGLGTMKAVFKIHLQENAQPFNVVQPRKIPLPILDKVKSTLETLQSQGVIEPVEHPTKWVATLVVVPKPNGSVRLCQDYTKLNRFVERMYYPMPLLDIINPSPREIQRPHYFHHTLW